MFLVFSVFVCVCVCVCVCVADDDCGPSHSTETAEKLLTKSSVE